MFTGIVTDLGTVNAISGEASRLLRVRCGFPMHEVAIGASLACDGICLTVTMKGEDWFQADASPETLSCTTLGTWRVGRRINLERPLRMGDELGGHLVSGHVDGVATLLSVTEDHGSRHLLFRAPDACAKFIAEKGSVCLNGVSLTVNDVQGTGFRVTVIPHTLAVTNIGGLAIGDAVNLEVDVIARYAARLSEAG